MSIHTWLVACGFGNGCSSGCLCKYVLNISAVRFLSLYVPDACPFVPLMRIIPCSASMSCWVALCSSMGEHPISARIVNIGAYFLDALLMINSTFCFVGIRGVFSSTL